MKHPRILLRKFEACMRRLRPLALKRVASGTRQRGRRIAESLITVSIAASMLVAATGGAQCQPLFRIGPQLGLNLADASASPLAAGIATRAQSGLIAGATLEVRIAPSWFIVASPRFIQKGAFLCYGLAEEESFQYDYLELPLHVRREFGHELLSPFLHAGATLGRLASARHLTYFQRGNNLQYVMELTKPWDLSLDVGAGFRLDPLDRYRFEAGITYSHGLVNILRGTAGVEAATWHSRDVKISICCLYSIE
jgi:hypothetical protein